MSIKEEGEGRRAPAREARSIDGMVFGLVSCDECCLVRGGAVGIESLNWESGLHRKEKDKQVKVRLNNPRFVAEASRCRP